MPSLLKLPGVGPIVAGVLLVLNGRSGGVLQSPHHFASYCGAAPVERGSGQNRRMQINPGGNRRLNWASSILLLWVRLRIDGGRSKRLFDKAQLRGKTKRALLSDFLKRTLLDNYFESYNELRRALLSFFPTNTLMLDGILGVGRQVRPPRWLRGLLCIGAPGLR